MEEHGPKAASSILETFSKYLVDLGLTDVEGSMKMRLELKQKGRDVSHADAVGYFLARRMGVKFLTGDMAFRGMDDVQYLE